ncbi:MBL fold metallo-hydrolase [Niallia taxi]|uniref:MBL fold metallo-hydrolase n=1 Tax=Niallia taxi TaxID=2499688 RepID=A0A3S2W682_9BACI|nr:MBL fold metallo-hydrolase [Niallia taxi]MCM3215834.1 MBL fold metallo-hydrolase [Niallia taxi]RVT65731.1 MBL fold metallo-hydrolase [Niallia taxi]
MKITKIGNVYQLSFMPRFFPVNCYFVEEKEGLTLIDCALPYSSKHILAAAKKVNKPITRIVLTHAHDDHVGSLDALKEALPHAPVYISRRDSRLLKGDTGLESGEPDTPIRGGVPKKIITKPDILLEDGDEIGALLTISTPGHTPGSLSFFDKSSRAIITGDALQTRGGVAVAGQLNPLFPFPAFATWNKELALNSANKLLELSPYVLAVGHGKMITDPAGLMKKAIERSQK